MPVDIQKLLELAPLVVAAMKPGSPEAAAVMQGWLHTKEQIRQQQMQDQRMSSEDAFRQAQMANLTADYARADQSLDIARQNARTNAFRAYHETTQVPEAVLKAPELAFPANTDVLATQNQNVIDRLGAQQALGIPAGTPQGPLPNLTALVSQAKKRRAQKRWDEYAKARGDAAAEAAPGERETTGEFAGQTFDQIRQTAEAIAPSAKPATPGTPGDYISKWAREHGKSSDALTAAETAGALKQYRDATQKTPITGGVEAPPPIPAGSLKIEQVPDADRPYVQGMLDYRLPMPTGYALARSPVWMHRVDLATAVDPSFDVTQYAARQKARGAFTSGKEAQNIRGLNTAVGHIDSLVNAAAAMQNGNWSDANAALNLLSQHAPVTAGLKERQGAATNIRAKFNAVTGELASIFKQSGATDQEIASWKNTVGGDPAAATPKQWKAFVDGSLELMGSRMTALTNQYEVAMGKPKDFRLLSPQSRAILSKLGQNVDAMDPIGTTGASGSSSEPTGRIRVKGPNGESGTVPAGTILPPGWVKQ